MTYSPCPRHPRLFLEAVVANRGEPFSYDQLPSLVYALVTWPILSCVVLHLTDAFVARYRRSPRRRERITARRGAPGSTCTPWDGSWLSRESRTLRTRNGSSALEVFYLKQFLLRWFDCWF